MRDRYRLVGAGDNLYVFYNRVECRESVGYINIIIIVGHSDIKVAPVFPIFFWYKVHQEQACH